MLVCRNIRTDDVPIKSAVCCVYLNSREYSVLDRIICLLCVYIGVWGSLKVSSGSRAGAPVGFAPRKLLGFEYLGSFSVNNFEAFCECDEVY
jgi:hypothetical protein